MSTTSRSSSSTGAGIPARLDARLLRIAAVIVLGGLMSIIDTTIVNVAINTLSQDFNASLAIIQWVSTGYTLALAMVIPLTGWATDRFGAKRLYIVSIALFLAGSALSGVAWSAGSLILFRVLQGFGGGMIMPVGMTILTHAAGPQRVGRVMGIVGAPMLLGPILGPILGGYLVEDVSWRWIFFVNVPIGVVALFAAVLSLDADEPKPGRRLDWAGLLLLSPGLAILVYGLSKMASGGGDDFVVAAGCFALGVGLLLAFIQHARSRDDALIDIRLFAGRVVGASALTTFLFAAAFFGLGILTPLYFQVVRGQSPLEAGLLVAAQGFGAMITMPIAGRLTDRSGPGKVVLAGLALVALGTFSLSRITSATPFWEIESTLFVIGLGAGATMMPAMSAALAELRRDEVARATSGLNVVLRVGGSIGTALVAVALTNQLSRLLPSAHGARMGLSAVHNIPEQARAVILPRLGEAFGGVFLWSFSIAGLAIVASLFLPRKKIEPRPDAEG